MIRDFIAEVNCALEANDSALRVDLSETAADLLDGSPSITAWVTSETFDSDLERDTHQRSVLNRVPLITFRCLGGTMCEAESIMQDLILAIHDANYGTARVVGAAWNRDTRHLQHSREVNVTATCKIPITRVANVPAAQNTVIENIVDPDGTPFHVELATVIGMQHVQSEPSAVWRCVFVDDDGGAFSSTSAPEAPVVSYPEPRVCVLTFSVPRTGTAFFV